MHTANIPAAADPDSSTAAASPKRDVPGPPWPSGISPAVRQRKVLQSLRIDPDVLEWFRAQGPRYQTRMNAVLRAYMEHARSGWGPMMPASIKQSCAVEAGDAAARDPVI